MKDLGCPPEVYFEGLFTKYRPQAGREYPIPSTIKFYSFLVMEYIKRAKISYGNFYQIPDGIEDDMAKQVGRGVINYFRLKDLITDPILDDKEEQLISYFTGSFDDYFIVTNQSLFIKYCEDPDHLKTILNQRCEAIQYKLEYFKINFNNYEKLIDVKARISARVKDYLEKNSHNALSDNLSDIQRELETVKYRL